MTEYLNLYWDGTDASVLKINGTTGIGEHHITLQRLLIKFLWLWERYLMISFCMFSYDTPLPPTASFCCQKWPLSDGTVGCEFWGLCSGVTEDSGILGCDTVSRSEWLLMCQRNPSPSPFPLLGSWRMPKGFEGVIYRQGLTQWTEKWWTDIKVWDRLAFTVGGVREWDHNWWAVGSVTGCWHTGEWMHLVWKNGERMEVIQSREQCPLLDQGHECGWYAKPASPTTWWGLQLSLSSVSQCSVWPSSVAKCNVYVAVKVRGK